MSTTVDSRVVQMKFDNSQFESGVKQTMGTLDKLKSALNFTQLGNTFSNLGKSIGNFNMDSLYNSVQNVSNAFTTLGGIIEQKFMSLIGNKAVSMISNFINSFSQFTALGGMLTQGWGKYEEKTASVQTIMAATNSTWEQSAKDLGFMGTQMEFVDAQLDKLNWFTDETSYSYTDMASNIGKFTANNIPLEDAVTSMQGIATWAAISGQKASSASRAMYNLSQSLGMGSVKLQDWMSIENANMATAEFKEKALEAAVAAGTLKKSADGLYSTVAEGTQVTVENFRTTLSEGWFDTKTLQTVLEEYGGFTDKLYDVYDATGVTATEMLGLVEANKEGTLTITELENVARDYGVEVQKLKDYVDELSKSEYDFGLKAFQAAQEAKTWSDVVDATKDAVSTGWMKTFELIFGNYAKAKDFFTDMAEAMYDLFAGGTDARNELLEEWGSNSFTKFVNELQDTYKVYLPDMEGSFKAAAKRIGVDADALTEKYGTFVDALKAGEVEGEQLRTILTDGFKHFVSRLDETSTSATRTAQTLQKVQDIYDGIISGKAGSGETRSKWYADQELDEEYWENLVKNGKDYKVTIEDLDDEMLKSIGYTEEQIDALKGLSDQMDITGSDINLLISDINSANDLTGRDYFLEGLVTTLGNLSEALKVLKKAWSNAMPDFTAETLTKITEGFYNLTQSFRLFKEDYEKLPEDEQLTEFGQTVYDTGYSIFNVLSNVWTIAKNLINLAIDAITRLNPLIKAASNVVIAINNIFAAITGHLADVSGMLSLGEGFTAVVEFLAKVLNKVADILNIIAAKIETWGIAEKIQNLITKMKKLLGISEDVGLLAGIWEQIKDAFSPLIEIFDNLSASIGSTRSYFSNLFATVKSNTGEMTGFGAVLQNICGFFKELKNRIKSFISGTNEAGEAVNGLPALIQNVIAKVQELWGWIKDTLEIGENGIDWSALFDKIGDKIVGMLNLLKKVGGDILGWFRENFTIKNFLYGLLAAGSIKRGTALTDALVDALGGVGNLGNTVGDTIGAILEKLGISAGSNDEGITDKLYSLSSSLLNVAKAIALVAASLLVLALIPEDKLTKAIMALVTGLGWLIIGLKAMEKWITAIGTGKLIALAGALIGIAVAMLALAAAVAVFTLLDTIFGERLLGGLATMAGALIVVGAALALLSYIDSGRLLAVAGALLIMSVAMIALGAAVGVFALLNAVIGDGMMDVLLSMAVALGAVALALGLLGKYVNPASLIVAAASILVVSAALVVAASAVLIFAAALGMLSLFDASKVALAMLDLVILLAAVAVALIALGAAGPVVLVGAAALLVAAVACVAFAAAVGVVSLVMPLLAYGLKSLGEAILSIGTSIFTSISLAGTAIMSVLTSIGTGVGNLFEEIGRGIGEGISKISGGIDDFKESITGLGGSIMAFGKSFDPLEDVDLINLGVGLIEFGKGLKKVNDNALESSDVDTLERFSTVIDSLDSIKDKVNSAFSNTYLILFKIGRNMVAYIAKGITDNASAVAQPMRYACANAVSAARSYDEAFETIGFYIINGIVTGLYNNSDAVANMMTWVTKKAIKAANEAADIDSPSRVMAEMGYYLDAGLAKGLKDNVGLVTAASDKVIDSTLNIARSLSSAISESMENDISPTITPVVDLSSAYSSLGSLNGTMSVGVSSALASRIGSVSVADRTAEALAGLSDKIGRAAISIASADSNRVVKVNNNINFEGSLAQLAAVLQPYIVAETARRGPSLINA